MHCGQPIPISSASATEVPASEGTQTPPPSLNVSAQLLHILVIVKFWYGMRFWNFVTWPSAYQVQLPCACVAVQCHLPPSNFGSPAKAAQGWRSGHELFTECCQCPACYETGRHANIASNIAACLPHSTHHMGVLHPSPGWCKLQ